ncbi:sulfotransferase family protein [Halomonas denitrificans]|uniref:sulfotransferase family protein n=1 Tax=Halomonas denitrificans TaxID=370769 RepID=UPI0013001EC6|nr:sulfotransferase [Halomonas denitrificans]
MFNNGCKHVFIVGAQKAGTTTIYDWLSQHPSISASVNAKDYPYFSDEEVYRRGREVFNKVHRSVDGKKTLGADANISYRDENIYKLKEEFPLAKVIMIKRNPVDRAFSAYCHAVERGLENRSFDEALDYELKGGRYEQKDSLWADYLKHGDYTKQVQVLRREFSENNVEVVDFEKMINQPAEVFQNLCCFIGVDSSFVPRFNKENSTKGGVRIRFVSQFLHGYSPRYDMVKKFGRIIPFPMRSYIRKCLVKVNRVEGNKPMLSRASREKLEQYYGVK